MLVLVRGIVSLAIIARLNGDQLWPGVVGVACYSAAMMINKNVVAKL